MSLLKVWKVQLSDLCNTEKLVLLQTECSQELKLVCEEMPLGEMHNIV